MKETISKQLIEDAIGAGSTTYYLEKFLGYRDMGLPLFSWNWAGLVFGFLWFAYRKIWFAVLPLLVILVGSNWLLSDAYASIARGTAVAAGSICGAIFGNQLYFLWIKLLIWQGKHNGKEGEELRAFIKCEGGTLRNMPVSKFLKH